MRAFFFFFFCALRLSSRSNRTSRTTTEMSPYFCIVRCQYYRILLLPSLLCTTVSDTVDPRTTCPANSVLHAPGMSSNHRGRRPGARRSEDARRQSAGVRRSFFANSSASPAKDALGLVPLTDGRRAVLPSMHGRSFTAPLTREALRAERRASAERAVQGVLKVAFCSFLDRLPPRLPPRPSTNPTFTSFLTQTPIMLAKELMHLPDAPSLLTQR